MAIFDNSKVFYRKENGGSILTANPSRFPFLDGIRGLSALLVVFYHATLFTGTSLEQPSNLILQILVLAIRFGGYVAVTVFIVLSGFSLSIPIARSPDQWFKGGLKRYLFRRSKRILPPYYFALIFSLALLYCFPIMQTKTGTVWDSKIPVTFDSVMGHLFLVHNLNKDWILKIDGPLWSVATEWQIYFVFIIMILIRNKLNIFFSVLFSFLIALLLYFLGLKEAHPQFIGVFSLGMFGAILCFNKSEKWANLRVTFSKPWLIGLWLFLMPSTLLVLYVFHQNAFLYESYFGILCLLFIVSLTLNSETYLRKPTTNILLSIFNGPILRKFGEFSYSLYLVHSPILGLANLMFIDYRLTYDQRLLFMWCVVTPIAMIISWLFYLICERPFQLRK